MDQESRERFNKHDSLINANRDNITKLMSQYNADQKWLRDAMTEQSKKLDRLGERVDAIDRTVNNGIKERQIDISKRLGKVETVLKSVVTEDDLADHKEQEKQRTRELWSGHERRGEEKRKNLSIAISIVGNVLTLLSVVALYLSLS